MSEVKVAHYTFFPKGGIGLYATRLLPYLAQRDDLNISLICTPEFHWKKIEGVNIHPILFNLHNKRPLIRKSRFLLAQFINPIRAIKKANADGCKVIHFHSFNHLTFPIWFPVLKKAGLKMVIAAHDVRRKVAIINKKWEEQQLIACYQSADGLIVHAEYQAQELIQMTGIAASKIIQVPHGPYAYSVPTAGKTQLREQHSIPIDAEVALFFGQIRDEKNLEGFLKAMAKSDAATHLIVAGQLSNHYKSELHYKSLIHNLDLEKRVHLHFGHIPDHLVGDYFTICDWVALPYLSSFTSQSGVLNVAAHYNKPVLTSYAPVLKETVQKSNIGLVCDSDQTATLAKGIEEMSRQYLLFEEQSFLQYRQHHSWEENARLTNELYSKIIA